MRVLFGNLLRDSRSAVQIASMPLSLKIVDFLLIAPFKDM